MPYSWFERAPTAKGALAKYDAGNDGSANFGGYSTRFLEDMDMIVNLLGDRGAMHEFALHVGSRFHQQAAGFNDDDFGVSLSLCF